LQDARQGYGPQGLPRQQVRRPGLIRPAPQSCRRRMDCGPGHSHARRAREGAPDRNPGHTVDHGDHVGTTAVRKKAMPVYTSRVMNPRPKRGKKKASKKKTTRVSKKAPRRKTTKKKVAKKKTAKRRAAAKKATKKVARRKKASRKVAKKAPKRTSRARVGSLARPVEYEMFPPSVLKKMPTIDSGQYHDLKYDDGKVRYWLSRMAVEDGETNAVHVEERRSGRWVDVHQYGAPQRASRTKNPDDLPFEKPQHKADFIAGFKAGSAAFKKDPNIDSRHARKAFRRVWKKHGSWWEDGFIAAIDNGRGLYRHSGVMLANKLGLLKTTNPGQPPNKTRKSSSPRRNPGRRYEASEYRQWFL